MSKCGKIWSSETHPQRSIHKNFPPLKALQLQFKCSPWPLEQKKRNKLYVQLKNSFYGIHSDCYRVREYSKPSLFKGMEDRVDTEVGGIKLHLKIDDV